MTRYLHTMIRVTDPAATVAFFELIGLKEVRRYDNEAGRFTLIFLACPGQEEGPHVELTHNWDQAGPYALGSGFGHIAIGVPDIHAACARLAAADVPIPRPPGPMQHGGTVIAFAEDPDGYRIELIERS